MSCSHRPSGVACCWLRPPDGRTPCFRSHLRSTGVEFLIEQAAGTGGFLPLARLTLHLLRGEDISFDPVLHTDPTVRPLPQWLTDFRRAAYRRSREGREAE